MNEHQKEIERLIQIVNTSAVNRISPPFKVEDAYKPKSKEELKEAIKVVADTPEEAQAFMALLQNAGLKQSHEMPDMDTTEEEEEIPQGADYANSPDEDYESDPLDTYSTKPNKQKNFRRTNMAGDNPLADSLMAEWQETKNTTEEVVESKIEKRGNERYQYLQTFLKLEKKPNKTQADKEQMKDLKRKMADLSA